MNKPLIKPQTLKGFRDYLPSQMIAREHLIGIARDVYRSYGFSPIDTPALEYSEILLGKGGEEADKQMYRFRDQGDRDVALRFDLTVPLARFAAEHLNEIGVPFKRYHIGTVWRADKPQKGRFREFVQCDFDTIGTESIASDIETLLVIHDLMERLGFSRFTVRVNNRLVLNGILEALGLTERASGVLRALDKLPKIGADAVLAEMTGSVGTTAEQAARVLEIADLAGPADEVLSRLERPVGKSEQGRLGVERLRQVMSASVAAGVPGERLVIDVSIARGLDYYTGTIYETFLSDLPRIGSVCSGGRYDNLAGLFTSQPLPGVGASLGLDRLLDAMQDLGMLSQAATPAAVLMTVFDEKHLGDYLRAARQLRGAGIATEVYPEAKRIGQQLKYASRKGCRVAVIAGDEEFNNGTWQVKDLDRGEQHSVAADELAGAVGRILASPPGASSG